MRGSDSLTKAECDKLIAAISAIAGPLAIRDRMMIEVFASTGLRVSELAALRVSQVLDGGRAREVMHLDRKATKRGRGGKLPISEKLRGSLESYFLWLRSWYAGDWLFPGYEGRHITPRAIQLRIKELRERAELRKKITPHSLRKFFIQRLIDQKLDLRSVMELSRHSSLESLHCYLVVDEEAARAAVEQIWR